MATEDKQINPFRLRIGVVLIVLWWFPFWALSPYIANLLGLSTAVVTTTIVIIQTVIGAIGIYFAGKQAAAIIKATPKRQVPSTIWHIFRHGSTS